MTEDFSLIVDGEKIVGQIVRPPDGNGPQPALIICHGIPSGAPPDPNAGGYPALAERFGRQGWLTCIFSFRGTGASQGSLDLVSWAHDLEAVVGHLWQLPGVDRSRLAVMGFSGGAATAAYVAARDNRIAAVILCACPADFSRMADKPLQAMFDQCLAAGTVKEGFPTSLEEWGAHFREVSPVNWIAQLSPRPLLIIHGDADELIDPEQARTLYHLAGEPKQLAIVPGEGHRLRHSETVIATAIDWLERWR